jgi:AsmA protein
VRIGGAMKKAIIIIIAVLAVITIGLIGMVKIYVTPERVKGYLIPYAEQKLDRKIDIGEVNIGLFKGIDVKDFVIKEKDGKSDFVKCRDFVLKFQILPLLSKKIVIDELHLLSPELKIARDDKGTFNYEDIGNKREAASSEKKTAETKGLPVSLLVNNVIVKDASFSFQDGLKELPGIKGSLSLKTGLKSSDGSKLFSEGTLDLILNEVTLQKKLITNVRTELSYATHIDLESDDVRMDKADLKVQGVPVSITGDIKGFKKGPELDISFSLPKLKVADLQKELSSIVDLQGLSLSGDISADIKLKGPVKKIDALKVDGRVILEKTGITFRKINTVLDGKLKFSQQSADIDMKGTVGKNTADIKGSVSDFFKTPHIKLNLYSRQLFLDEVLPGAGTAKDQPVPGGNRQGSTVTSKEAAPLDLKLTAEGEIKIDSATYKGMNMTDFYTRYQLKDNKFEIVKMTAVAGKGKFLLNSTVDLSKPGYVSDLSGSLDSLHADEVVNSFFPKAKDTVFGVLSLNIKANGAGTLPESIRKNLVGNGDFRITDGKIKNAKIAENLAVFLNIDELKTINLKQAKGTIKIKSGVARLDSVFVSDDIAMDPAGDIGLDETLDLAFDLKLSPRLSKKTVGSGVAKYIRDEEGWGMIPLKVSGTFAKPSYTVDVAKAGKRVIKKEAEKFLDKLFKKETDKKATEGGTQEKKSPAEDLLKGIFK